MMQVSNGQRLSLRAQPKQSISASTKKEWIASELTLLVMTWRIIRTRQLFVSRARCGVQRRFAEPGPMRAARGMGPGSAAHHFAPLMLRCARDTCIRPPAARIAPELCINLGPSKNRGRREDRVSDAPAASHAKVKSIRVNHHRFAGAIRPSLRNGFNGFLRALPGDRACLPPSPAEDFFRQLDASVGASGPHDFAVRERHALVMSAARVHRVPSRVRDDRERPSEGRDRDSIKLISSASEEEYFSDRGWTRFF